MSMRQRRPASPLAQRNNARAFRHSVLAVGIAMLLASPAMAQDAATQQDAAGQDGKDKKEDAKDLDKVVVTGIRGSVYKAQDIKRDADTFVDSVTALDIATYAGVSLAFLGVMFAASYVPARQAATIDPQSTMRYE